MAKKLYELQIIAASLYDGGWRSTDKEELMTEYEMDSEYAEQICYQLKLFEGVAM